MRSRYLLQTRVTPFSTFLVNFRSDYLILLDDTSYETLIMTVNGKTQLLSLFSRRAYMATEAFRHHYHNHRHQQTASIELRKN